MGSSFVPERDSSNRPITRMAATKSGWHYQAHCVEFETSKLNSLHNKDRDGNDFGFATIKYYDPNDDELVSPTQATLDSSCVKTEVKWAPSYDFEVISGQIRQAAQGPDGSYLYVSLFAPTGLAAPNDLLEIPFVEGGINLNYIGADEILRTDGRAGKLVQGTLGQHFKTFVNHAVGSNHKVSVIYEIYKSVV